MVDGDSRLEAAKLLGLSSVPCIRVDHLDETEQRLLRLAVNRLAEKGFWDIDELEAEFKELIIADAPIEISGDVAPNSYPVALRVWRLPGRIPKVRPVQLRISGLVGASAECRGRWIKDKGVLSPIAL